MRPMPPLARAAMTASAAVPIANERKAACQVPIERPSPELIGACSATRPPVNAVSRTAAPRSTARPAPARRPAGAAAWRDKLSLGLHPRRADADVDRQRRVVLPDGAHLLPDQLAHAVDLGG